MFVKNVFISNMLENGAINNPVLISAFEFVKNVSKLERRYLDFYVFTNFYAWKQLFIVYKILM